MVELVLRALLGVGVLVRWLVVSEPSTFYGRINQTIGVVFVCWALLVLTSCVLNFSGNKATDTEETEYKETGTERTATDRKL